MIENIENLLKQGFSLLNNEDYSGANVIANRVLEKRYNIDALALAGISLFRQNEFEKSEKFFIQVINENPKNIIIVVYYLRTLKKQNKIEEGINYLATIKTHNKDLIEVGIELYEKIGNYRKVLKIAKTLEDSIQKHEIMSWSYEKLNRIKKAKKSCQKGLKIDKKSFRCNLVYSRILTLSNNLSKAKKQLKNINKEELSYKNLALYYAQIANILEKKLRYTEAFEKYSKSNNCLKKSQAFKDLQGNSNYTFDKILKIKKYFSNKPKYKHLTQSKVNITFMVGYPRSGTTLLENILNAHSEISTIEEKPTVDNILNKFLKNESSINRMDNISANEIESLQSEYLKTRNLYTDKKSKIIIDKLPLNLIHIGILYRVFPNAKFIISTRDIRDVALSCYFQSFAINDAMSYFLEWDTTREYLRKIMQLGMSILKNYPVNHKIVVYEELVKNPYKVVKQILEFLDLEWQESIRNYRKEIKGKNINTPSYYTVNKKINTGQVNRWKNYIKYFT